jgi:hypothetical protein
MFSENEGVNGNIGVKKKLFKDKTVKPIFQNFMLIFANWAFKILFSEMD